MPKTIWEGRKRSAKRSAIIFAHQKWADHPGDRTDRVGPPKVTTTGLNLGPKANRFQIVGARDV